MEGKKCEDELNNLNQYDISVENRNSESKEKETYVKRNVNNFFKINLADY